MSVGFVGTFSTSQMANINQLAKQADNPAYNHQRFDVGDGIRMTAKQARMTQEANRAGANLKFETYRGGETIKNAYSMNGQSRDLTARRGQFKTVQGTSGQSYGRARVVSRYATPSSNSQSRGGSDNSRTTGKVRMPKSVAKLNQAKSKHKSTMDQHAQTYKQRVAKNNGNVSKSYTGRMVKSVKQYNAGKAPSNPSIKAARQQRNTTRKSTRKWGNRRRRR